MNEDITWAERQALAQEIVRRRLKFADVTDGHYEMLSEHETRLIVKLLFPEPPKHPNPVYTL